MKRMLILGLLLFAGCAMMESVTAEKPMGTMDPNDVQGWINTAVAASQASKVDPNDVEKWVKVAVTAGQASEAVGVATGNPALMGAGILAATIASVFLVAFKKKE